VQKWLNRSSSLWAEDKNKNVILDGSPDSPTVASCYHNTVYHKLTFQADMVSAADPCGVSSVCSIVRGDRRPSVDSLSRELTCLQSNHKHING